MSKVVVLGGSGAVGRVSVKTLVRHNEFSEVVIADYQMDKAEELCKELNSPKVTAIHFNAFDKESIRKAIKGCDVVLNCVGPFYSTVKPILELVIEEKINYVDVCDDVDVTLEILGWDKRVKEAGITALIGMGNSPGITNLLAKLASEQFLDETDSIDIFHAHGGEPFEGEGVIAHRFHCMSIDIPMFLEGELKYVKYFEENGIALRQSFEFPLLGSIPLYPYPHPEQVTLPKYLKTKQVTNKGSVVPNEYYNLTRDMCMLGLHHKNVLDVKGTPVNMYDFSVAYILKERERILKETNFGIQRGCCSVVVKGKSNGKHREYRFHLASRSQALGEGTGIPAAMGAIMMNIKKVYGKGVMPPEACLNPMEFISIISDVMDLGKKDSDDFKGIIIEKVDENGTITNMDV